MTMRHPYYELRLYEMLPTRVTEFHDLLGRQVPPIFARSGIAKPVGFWESYVGPLSPLYAYLIPWSSVDERLTAWTRFYSDPEWIEKLATNYAGQQRVQRANVSILKPAPLWDKFSAPEPPRPTRGVHEIRIYACQESSEGSATQAWLSETALPRFVDNGAELMGAFVGCIGLPTNATVVFLAWSNEETMRRGRRNYEVGLETNSATGPARCIMEHIMKPIDYGVPYSGFAEM